MKKSNKFFKNVCIAFLSLITVISLSSCKWVGGKNIKDQKKLNIFINTKDEHSNKVIKFLVDDYKKNNPDVEIKLNDILGDKSNVMDTINLGTEIDVMFNNRNDFIELSKKGVLSDMEGAYECNNINSRYFNIIGSYGRIGDKYYGIGVVPDSIELFYNKTYLQKLKIADPNNLEEWLDVLKQINGKGIKTPVVLNEDIDASGILFSLIASKGVNIHEVEESYDSGEQGYIKLKNMQGVFDEFNLFIKKYGITKNSFELGNEQSVTNFNSGDSPLLMGSSYYNTKLNGNNIGVIGDYDNSPKFGSNVLININAILSVPVNAKNGDSADAFIQYIYSDEVQARLVKNGIITGNKVANNKITGISKSMVQHIYKANDNSMIILNNFPRTIKNNILLTLKKITDGNYSSKEWEEILKESYK